MPSAAHDMAHNRLYSGCAQKYIGTDFWLQSSPDYAKPGDVPQSPPGFLAQQAAPLWKHRVANRSHGIQNPRMQCHIWTSPLAGTVHFQYSPKV